MFCGGWISRATISNRYPSLVPGKVKTETVEGQAGHLRECIYYQIQQQEAKRMGAFDGDKTLGRGEILHERFKVGDEFIVWASEHLGEIEIPGSDLGPTDKVVLTVSEKISPNQKFEIGCIGASANKLKNLTEDELPAICKLIEFKSKFDTTGRMVQWQRDYDATAEAQAEAPPAESKGAKAGAKG